MNSWLRFYSPRWGIATAMYLAAVLLSSEVAFCQTSNPQRTQAGQQRPRQPQPDAPQSVANQRPQEPAQSGAPTTGPRPADTTPTGPPAEPHHFPGEALFNANPPFLTGVAVDHKEAAYQEGQKLRIQFMAERDAHLYLIYHQADGVSLLLFPNVAQKLNRVPGGKPLVIPTSEKDLRIRIQAPFGREVLQVLATVEPVADLNDLVGRTDQFPIVSPEVMATISGRLLKAPATWTEHRVPIQTVAKAARPPERRPDRIGLFVGIGKYAHPEHGPTHAELGHSAEVMHDLMLKHGRLDPQRTRLVMNEHATKANLQEQITRWLPSVSQPGDTVFLYFSGHAGQFAIQDPGESSRQQQYIGPYDLNSGTQNMSVPQRMQIYRASNISSRELARWLEELPGRQIVFIFDTCHSGGLFRSKGFDAGFMTAEASQIKALAQMNMLVLASCAADEQSLFEGTKNKTMWFTYCLTEAIENPSSSRPLTVQAAFDYSRQRMRTLLREGNAGREQEPQMTDMALLPIELIPK